MRKVVFLVIALFAMSCTNDDIEILKNERKFKLTYNVSTQGMYDTFGLTNDIESYLRDRSLCIGVTSFLYDSNGDLVDKKFSSAFTFTTITEVFEDLPEGNYTVVTVEMLVNPEDEFKAEDWALVEEGKLATLRIKQKNSLIHYTSAIGVCSTSFSFLSNSKTINVTPSAIGSLVEMQIDNSEKLPYSYYIGFATNDIIEGYKLDPSLPRKDRYVLGFTSSGNVNVRGSLSAESPDITLYLLESSIDWSFCLITFHLPKTAQWTYGKGFATLDDGARYYGGIWYKDSRDDTEYYFGNYNGYESWLKDLLSSQAFYSKTNEIINVMKGYRMYAPKK